MPRRLYNVYVCSYSDRVSTLEQCMYTHINGTVNRPTAPVRFLPICLAIDLGWSRSQSWCL